MNLVQFPGLWTGFSPGPRGAYHWRVQYLLVRRVHRLWPLPGAGICVPPQHRVRRGPGRMVDVILIGIVLGIVSARAYYVAMAPFKYESIWEMLAIRDGGLAIYGGIIGGFLFGGLACKRRGVPVLPMFDLTAMGFLHRAGLRPLGQLFQPGGLWLQHRSAVGHVQRGHQKLPHEQHGHEPRKVLSLTPTCRCTPLFCMRASGAL